MSSTAGRLDRWITLIETVLLALVLGAMLGLSVTQILLRNLVDSGIAWADPLVRAMVLWLGLLGAVVAARRDRHIRIDVLTRFAGPRGEAALRFIGAAVTSVVCALIAWHGGRMVQMEHEFGTVAFSGIPAWTLQLVIPLSFALVALLYAIGAGIQVLKAIRGPAE